MKKVAFLLLTILILSGSAFAVPTATLTPNITSGTAPLAVNFSESSCSDNNIMRPIVSCIIDLGDGNTADFNSFGWLHTYYTADDYYVELTALNSWGESDNSQTQINVSSLNQAPTATLDLSPASGESPLTVTFTGFCSDPDENADLATCIIAFGDGNTDTFTNEMTHVYYTEGTYVVTLTATDSEPLTGTDNDSVTVTAVAVNQAPVAIGVSILPSSPVTTDNLDCNYFYSDSENNLEGTTTFRWFKGGVETIYIGKTIMGGETAAADTWICKVTPVATTGTLEGTEVSSDPVTIATVATPTITSNTTHDEDSWETSDDVTVYWSTVSETTYYCVLDGDTDTDPTTECPDGYKEYDDHTNGIYYFHLKAKLGSDESTVRHYKIKIDESAPGVPSNLSAVYDSDDDEVVLDWDASSGGESGINYYKIYRGTDNDFDDDASKIHQTSGNSTDYFSGTNLTDGKTYYYWVTAVNNAGTESEESDYDSTVFGNGTGNDDDNDEDNTAPYLQWEKPFTSNRDDLNGIIMLKVWSYDDESDIRYVQFRIDDALIATDNSASLERYIFDWDSTTVADGEHILKAISRNWGASDNQTTTKTITVITNNGIEPEEDNNVPDDDSNKVAAENAIDAASDKKETVDSVLAELDVLGIALDAEQAGLFTVASELLDEAQELFDDEDYEEAIEKADEAKEKFEELAGNVAVGIYGEEKQYVYNEEHLELMMKSFGFNQAVIDEAKAMLEGNNVERSLSFKQVGNNGETYYKAVITIVVKNDSDEAQEIKVIEVIPKEFAETASEIAGENFTVIVDDPVLEWVVSLEAGEEAIIVYALKSEMTAEEADAMLDSEILNKFSIPPVLVSSETELSETSFLGTGIGLFGLGGAVELGGWVVLIIAVIAIVALFVTGKIGSGKKEGPFGIQAAAGRAGFGSSFFDKVSRSGKEEESSGPKWKYKN